MARRKEERFNGHCQYLNEERFPQWDSKSTANEFKWEPFIYLLGKEERR